MNNNIAEIRNSLRMTQAEFAEKLGVNKTYISTLENKKDINKITLHKIAKILKTTENRIFDFSNRGRTKPNFNPHMEAFWTQGCQACEYFSEEERRALVDKQLSQLDERFEVNIGTINRIMNLGRYEVYCLIDRINDACTTEALGVLELLFAAGLAGAEFFVCAALMDNRIDIIQSFFNGVIGKKETRGGKDEVNNLKTIREQKGITQTALAKQCGVPLMTLRLIESKGRCSDVLLPKAKKIARQLNCEFTDLFSSAYKDIYNIQAKAAGKRFKKVSNAAKLIEVLETHQNSVELSVRDIVAFLNEIQRKNLLKTP